MENNKDKNLKLESSLRGKEGDFSNESSSRARNRTVMLTPEITGQVRARLAQELDAPAGRDVGADQPRLAGPSGEFSRPMTGGSGFDAPSQGVVPSGVPARPQLPPAASAATRSRTGGIQWSRETPIVGFLVSYDKNENGEMFELRTGRLMVSSQGSEPNTLLLQDDTVSPMHAIMRIGANGEIQVLDQLSEHGTNIKRYRTGEEEQLSGDKTTVGHGDILSFGKRSFYVCMVPRGPVEE